MHPLLERQPTSQYRNKTIFSLIANHKSEFGFPAVRNHFEAGHGKGPCDDVGRIAKRVADEAVKTGKVKIQDTVHFYNWARKNENSSSVSYRFYSKEEYSDAGKFLETKYKDVKAVPNTMKIHSVAGISAEQVKVKEASCYCDQCLTSEKFTGSSTCGWKTVTVCNEVTGSLDGRLAIRVNDWVAVHYEGAWYIEQVQQIDEQDKK